jgi:hypothetical protein
VLSIFSIVSIDGVDGLREGRAPRADAIVASSQNRIANPRTGLRS